MAESPDRLAELLGYRFSDPGLLEQALVHSSVVPGPGHRPASNERLEFLGDRVLGLVVARLLFERFAREKEGHLARRHAELVRKEALARVAERIGLGAYLHLARGEEEAGGRENPAILADACEAVIAALFLDGGLDAAGAFIRRQWLALIEEDLTPPKDSKTALQEWAQARGMALPDYRVVDQEGPAHEPLFRIEVSLEGLPPEVATGTSKRGAEQAAAGALLARLESGDAA